MGYEKGEMGGRGRGQRYVGRGKGRRGKREWVAFGRESPPPSIPLIFNIPPSLPVPSALFAPVPPPSPPPQKTQRSKAKRRYHSNNLPNNCSPRARSRSCPHAVRSRIRRFIPRTAPNARRRVPHLRDKGTGARALRMWERQLQLPAREHTFPSWGSREGVRDPRLSRE